MLQNVLEAEGKGQNGVVLHTEIAVNMLCHVGSIIESVLGITILAIFLEIFANLLEVFSQWILELN